MKKVSGEVTGVVAGIIAVIIVIMVLSINLVVFPYLLMVALGALGHEVSFVVALAFWLLTMFILNFIKGIFKK